MATSAIRFKVSVAKQRRLKVLFFFLAVAGALGFITVDRGVAIGRRFIAKNIRLTHVRSA